MCPTLTFIELCLSYTVIVKLSLYGKQIHFLTWKWIDRWPMSGHPSHPSSKKMYTLNFFLKMEACG